MIEPQGRAIASVAASDVAVPRRPLLERLRGWLTAAALVAVLAWSFNPVEMGKVYLLITDWRNMAEFLAGFAHPRFHDLDVYLLAMVETVQMALWGTALAVVIGTPLAVLASANVAPPWIVQPVRRLLDTFRACNEIVFALLFVVAVGLGPLAGVLALAVHNIGVVAKLFSEAVEAVDPRPVEGIRAAGATRLQEVVFGIVPQVMPLWASFTLYRFETNVRSATVLGIVGAGGIGQPLYENIRAFQYSEAATIIIVVVATVMLIDMTSAHIRSHLV